MRAMTPYLAEHLPIIEYLIEEFRLSIKDHAMELGDYLNLYTLDKELIRSKLSMLGLEVGILEESWQPTAMFYKIYRRLIRNRSTTGSVQTLARTGGQLEALYRTVDDVDYYTSLKVYRDYQAPHLFGKDGYFYMVYNPKYPLSGNALVTKMLPAGYCFACVTEFYGFDSQEIFEGDSLIDDGRVYISDFPDETENKCDLIDEGHVFERYVLDNIKGIMPQHDMGWSFGGLAVRDKTFGDLFRERDVRTQPMNRSWTELLNHAGETRYNEAHHRDHAFLMNKRDDGLIITDSMQYHKDLIIAERQEFDILHYGVSIFEDAAIFSFEITPIPNATVPTHEGSHTDLGSFGSESIETLWPLSMKVLAGYSSDTVLENVADIMPSPLHVNLGAIDELPITSNNPVNVTVQDNDTYSREYETSITVDIEPPKTNVVNVTMKNNDAYSREYEEILTIP